MNQIVDNLREQEYVSAANVEALRKYIRVKNPDSSREELSAVFADALHKIIDTSIYQFEEKHRKKIKADVLKKAVKKREFSINAAEVLSSCLTLKLHEDSYIESLTRWINQSQPIPVSTQQVDKLVSCAEYLEEEYINNNLDDIAYEADFGWTVDESIVELLQGTEHWYASPEDTAEAEWIERVREFVDLSGEVYTSSIDDIEEVQPVREAFYQQEYKKSVTESKSASIEAVPAEDISSTVPIEDNNGANLLNFSAAINMFISLVLENKRLLKPSIKLALAAALPLVIISFIVISNMSGVNRVMSLQHQDQGRYADITVDQVDRYMSLESKVIKKLGGASAQKDLILPDGLHDELKHVEIDQKKLKTWLDKKNSLLAEEPYFTAIMVTSKKYNINPLLMFAIIGQEQAFVPKNSAAAKKIANNPFNVYGSWEKYNTNIHDSSGIAADTIIKSSRNRPAYINAIKWINRRYAEDPNWWNGVSIIFEQMEKEIKK